MRPSLSIFLLVLISCGKAPVPLGTLNARIIRDPALSAAFTTEDGWLLKFNRVVVAIGGVGVPGVTSPSSTQLVQLMDAGVELPSTAMVEPKSYDGFSMSLSHRNSDDNVNVELDVLNRLGPRPLYVSGSASKQSTVKAFELTIARGVDFTACMPAVTVASGGTATVEFRIFPQRLFSDDTGKLRFDGWGAADGFPLDGTVTVTEAENVMTTQLPAAQYGMTTGSLQTVFEKRALGMVGLGETGSCTGAAK